MTDQTETRDVCIVGTGPAGLTAGLYTARAGLDTLAANTGESILRRNTHLENVPGFPAGVNSRLFLDMLEDQAERNGCDRQGRRVTAVDDSFGDHLAVETDDGTVRTDYVVCTSWADTEYLDLDGVGLLERGSKTYIDVNDRGETGVDGLYAAGRIAGEPHQTAVSAGHGAKVGLSVIHDSEIPFYHDWVTPEGYFTDRGREVPPGCEEIDEAERQRRERESMQVMRAYFDDPHPEEPTQHPSVTED